MKKMFLYVMFCAALGAAFLLIYFAGEDLLTGSTENVASILFYEGTETMEVPKEALPSVTATLLAYDKKAHMRNGADYSLPVAAPYSLAVYYADGTSDLFSYSDNHKLLFRCTDESRKKIMLVYDPDFTLLNQLLALFPEETPEDELLPQNGNNI